jgi:uncharacterized membrane protein
MDRLLALSETSVLRLAGMVSAESAGNRQFLRTNRKFFPRSPNKRPRRVALLPREHKRDPLFSAAVTKGRLEAFSDGVIAIIITIMVLELKVPHGAELEALSELVPKFLAYALSFVYVGIYWNNHHHLLHATTRIDGAVLWANLHLLFWLSLTPFATAWMGENHAAPVPVALYGVDMLLAAIAYYILVRAIIRAEGPHSRVAAAVGGDFKGKVSALMYAIAIPVAFVQRWVAIGIYVLVAMAWFVPDRRMVRQGGA